MGEICPRNSGAYQLFFAFSIMFIRAGMMGGFMGAKGLNRKAIGRKMENTGGNKTK